jgi:hypothetical protein
MDTWIESTDTDLLLTLAGLRDIIGSLHLHESVHPHPESLFDAERHVAGKIGAAVNAGRETLSAAKAAVTDRPARFVVSVRMKSPGWGGFLMAWRRYRGRRESSRGFKVPGVSRRCKGGGVRVVLDSGDRE